MWKYCIHFPILPACHPFFLCFIPSFYISVIFSHSFVLYTLGDKPWNDMLHVHRLSFVNHNIERFHSLGQHLCKFIGTKESVCVRKEFNSHRTGLKQQHGRRFTILGHQYGGRDFMWTHSVYSETSLYERPLDKDTSLLRTVSYV